MSCFFSSLFFFCIEAKFSPTCWFVIRPHIGHFYIATVIYEIVDLTLMWNMFGKKKDSASPTKGDQSNIKKINSNFGRSALFLS